jgi:hypothetical protein
MPGAVNHVAHNGDADMTPSAAAPQMAAISGTHLDGSASIPHTFSAYTSMRWFRFRPCFKSWLVSW